MYMGAIEPHEFGGALHHAQGLLVLATDDDEVTGIVRLGEHVEEIDGIDMRHGNVHRHHIGAQGRDEVDYPARVGSGKGVIAATLRYPNDQFG
ncbi:MAG: hypothetical protein NVV79_10045 [Devosia ginsengisoli]|nr:hypothetical protein [Devosia ginsengisoli]MCR6671655.1 hypothetical protein [Devosia ginsengisoli]